MQEINLVNLAIILCAIQGYVVKRQIHVFNARMNLVIEDFLAKTIVVYLPNIQIYIVVQQMTSALVDIVEMANVKVIKKMELNAFHYICVNLRCVNSIIVEVLLFQIIQILQIMKLKIILLIQFNLIIPIQIIQNQIITILIITIQTTQLQTTRIQILQLQTTRLLTTRIQSFLFIQFAPNRQKKPILNSGLQ